ncbi:hydrogenase maturation protease [Nitrosomonas supralitoralis]|uniref:Ni/Fe hydrogenase n=1 Tax=Nitrosomonas supralitoralis TaxID=2116706 RepID=A0A2P7NY89_9PROT|nr:hydrogenase maturation protease [Nitrosomonas supralitoralis]PSJ18414.1 Ni/Fe hydrogenase [Nitrosomonas supralitoralis]
MRILLFGYGNPGCGDDALGPLLIEHIDQLRLINTKCLIEMQLLIEHTIDLLEFDQIVFIDADMSCAEPYQFSTIHAEKDTSYTSHALTPSALLFTYQQIYQRTAPSSFLLRIRGYQFELGEKPSNQAKMNLQAAILKIQHWHSQCT